MKIWARIWAKGVDPAAQTFHRLAQRSADWLTDTWETLQSERDDDEGWQGQFSEGESTATNQMVAMDEFSVTNPATGLPMTGALDVEGNPYGLDLREDSLESSWVDDIHSGGGSFDNW